MKFIRDIIFEKRAARTTEAARSVDDIAEEAGAEPSEYRDLSGAAEAELAQVAEADAAAIEPEECFPSGFALEEQADLAATPYQNAPFVLNKPIETENPAVTEQVDQVEAAPDEGEDDDVLLDFDSSIAAFDIAEPEAAEPLFEDESDEPYVNPQQSFYERLKRIEAQRNEKQPPMSPIRAAVRPTEVELAPVVTPRVAAPKPVFAGPVAQRSLSEESPARPMEPVAKARTLDEMPFVRAPQTRVAPVATATTPAQQTAPRAETTLPDQKPSVTRTAAEPASAAFQVPPPAAGRGSDRSERVKTRLLGFNPDQIGLSDPFEKPADKTKPSFPVGWLVVVAGPGRGAAFALLDGVSRIGRGEDQSVSLNFGDNSISRENHVAVAFDAEQSAFFIGQSGRANIVRLNNKPLLSTEQLRSGDQIRVGETTLRFAALCGEGFSWAMPAGNDARHA